METAQDLFKKAIPFVQQLQETTLDLEGSYIESFIHYSLGKNIIDSIQSQLSFNKALIGFANLFSAQDYTAVRSLLRAGRTLKELESVNKANQCFQKILNIISNKTDFVYQEASQELEMQVVQNVPAQIKYFISAGDSIVLNLDAVKYYPMDISQVSLEGIYNDEIITPKDDFLYIWQRYRMPIMSIYPSLHKTANVVASEFPVF